MASKYQQHVAKWENCTECELCKKRRNVVLLRGSVPAPVLFVGEAPGESEDVIGSPFVGPAGKLLDKLIKAAEITKFAATNVIACIPKDELRKKIMTPPEFAVDACRHRLLECFNLVKPKLIVWVGEEAAKYGPKALQLYPEFPAVVKIIHPAAILRMDVSQQGLAYQRCLVVLRDALDKEEG